MRHMALPERKPTRQGISPSTCSPSPADTRSAASFKECEVPELWKIVYYELFGRQERSRTARRGAVTEHRFATRHLRGNVLQTKPWESRPGTERLSAIGLRRHPPSADPLSASSPAAPRPTATSRTCRRLPARPAASPPAATCLRTPPRRLHPRRRRLLRGPGPRRSRLLLPRLAPSQPRPRLCPLAPRPVPPSGAAAPGGSGTGPAASLSPAPPLLPPPAARLGAARSGLSSGTVRAPFCLQPRK